MENETYLIVQSDKILAIVSAYGMMEAVAKYFNKVKPSLDFDIDYQDNDLVILFKGQEKILVKTFNGIVL